MAAKEDAVDDMLPGHLGVAGLGDRQKQFVEITGERDVVRVRK